GRGGASHQGLRRELTSEFHLRGGAFDRIRRARAGRAADQRLPRAWGGFRGSEERRRMKQAELFDITGHVAFVTGAASGLGRAYAEAMAENGAKTVLADMDAAGLAAVAAALTAKGCDVEQAVLDIGDTDALSGAID